MRKDKLKENNKKYEKQLEVLNSNPSAKVGDLFPVQCERLNKKQQEINSMKHQIEVLKKSIEEKQYELKVGRRFLNNNVCAVMETEYLNRKEVQK